MKSIHIEQVANGWIARPLRMSDIHVSNACDVYVYQTLKALQDDLPRLLAPRSIAITVPEGPVGNSGGIGCAGEKQFHHE